MKQKQWYEQEKQTFVLATTNKKKVAEISAMLPNDNILTIADVGFVDDVEETGTTFEENSYLKAKAMADFLKQKGLNYIVIADDSGLCVDALGGEPGIYSARYCGRDKDYAGNRALLLQKLDGVKNRKACFKSAMVLIYPDSQHSITVVGETKGRILTEERGSNDLNFYPLFYSTELGKTFGEASIEELNSVSHRGRALEKLIKEHESYLKSLTF